MGFSQLQWAFDDCSARVSLIFRTASYSILFIFLIMDSEDFINDFLGEAISDVENLRHMQFRRKQNEKRKKGPRGPRPKVLAMKLYHLPEASQLPFFSFRFVYVGTACVSSFQHQKLPPEENR